MKTVNRLALVVVAAGLCAAAFAAERPKTVATLGGSALTEDQMRKDLGMQLYQAENALYAVEKNWIDQKAQEMLFDQAAREAGLSRKDWEAREIDAKTPPPDDA